MYTCKLALLVLSATAAYAYPAPFKNPDSLALVAPRPEQNMPRTIEDPRTATLQVKARQIHNADYQANGPPPGPNPGPTQESSSPAPANPAPSEPVPKDKRSDTALWRGPGVSSPSSPREMADKELDVGKSSVAMKTRSIPYPGTTTADRDTQARSMPRIVEDPDTKTLRVEADEKRQIHNADYQANGPPPSPNPGPAQESSSPTNPPAAAPSGSAPKDKRTESSFEHGPGSIIPSPSSSRAEKSGVANKKRSMGGPANSFGANVVNHHASKLVSRLADSEWYGWRRRNVEELTNIHNRNFDDHHAVSRWSRAEVDKMQA